MLVVGAFSVAYGLSSYLTSFNATYGTSGTALSTCSLCHPGGDTSQFNPYGLDYANAGSFAAIESLDSDGDGFTNIDEIRAGTFPGDATSHPTAADTTRPVVSAFVIPASASSLVISVTTFTATDNVAVTGYLLTETSATPLASAAGWTATALASYTFSSAGNKTLYAWAKDGTGNISAPLSRTTSITLPDTTAPVITGFTIPASSSSTTVSITTFTATDNVGVTGYLITETATTPLASAVGWSATAPASYTVSSAGNKTLYAWTKDAAGNISVPISRTTAITLPDTSAPVITGFAIPATSTSLAVGITSFTATDNTGVTGYLIKETSATPLAQATGWTTQAPTGYTFSSAGSKTLYAWAKDGAGNISAPMSAMITITLPDAAPPVVGSFAIPSSSGSLTVSISAFTATDNVGVTGYLVKETSTIPLASATGWSATPPASYTFGSAGSKVLYAWAKDAAGNVSVPLSAITSITLPDTVPPSVTGFVIPSNSNTLTIPITTFTATDNMGVTGYLVTEVSTAPLASAAGWTATAPSGYTFSSVGSKVLYAWAKDGAGNISTSFSASTTVAVSDATPPVIVGFTIPSTSNSLTVSITTFAATDNVAVTGYRVSESSAVPTAGTTGWSATPPAGYTFSSAGSKILYAWAKDGAGNISAVASDNVVISTSDATPPTITKFVIPSRSSSLTVPVTLTATDNVGVTGYLLTESSQRPNAADSKWRSTPPTSYTFRASRTRILYAWAKDGAGNISKSVRRSVEISYRGTIPGHNDDDEEEDD